MYFYCWRVKLIFRWEKSFYFYIDKYNVVENTSFIIAGSLESAYSLNWGAQEIWGEGGGETLALLWYVGLFN